MRNDDKDIHVGAGGAVLKASIRAGWLAVHFRVVH